MDFDITDGKLFRCGFECELNVQQMDEDLAYGSICQSTDTIMWSFMFRAKVGIWQGKYKKCTLENNVTYESKRISESQNYRKIQRDDFITELLNTKIP